MRKLLITAIATVTAANLWAIQGTIITGTETLKGNIKWKARTKQYVVTVKKGSTEVDLERKLEDVERLDIPKPAGYDKAVQQVEAGQGIGAISILSKIVSEYRMLQWDKPAGRYLVYAYLASNQPQKAYEACVPIVNEDKSAAYTGDLASAYWQALLKLGKREQLNELVKKASSHGDRRSSAAALVMRGDIIVADSNDAPDKLRQALSDGYLRVVLMYADPECARERVEALNKAAQCFDKLGQSARAENLRAQARGM